MAIEDRIIEGMHMAQSDLEKMADAVAALDGQNRQLDGEIFKAVGGPQWEAMYIRVQEPCGCPHDMAVKEAMLRAPLYTSSMDAALSLVPEGEEWGVSRNKDGGYFGECGYYAMDAKTGPTALAAAALVFRGLELPDRAAPPPS